MAIDKNNPHISDLNSRLGGYYSNNFDLKNDLIKTNILYKPKETDGSSLSDVVINILKDREKKLLRSK